MIPVAPQQFQIIMLKEFGWRALLTADIHPILRKRDPPVQQFFSSATSSCQTFSFTLREFQNFVLFLFTILGCCTIRHAPRATMSVFRRRHVMTEDDFFCWRSADDVTQQLKYGDLLVPTPKLYFTRNCK